MRDRPVVPGLRIIRVADVQPGDLIRGVVDKSIITGCPVRIRTVTLLPDGKRRFTYVIPGPWTVGWRDFRADKPLTIESRLM